MFNPSSQAVILESLALAGGAASPYTLYVNGRPGKSFGEQLLLGGDSLLLLLEARLPATAATRPYLASDAVVVRNKGLQQTVQVVGWGQNALFLGDEVLACNTVWDSSLPFVIEKSVLVDTLCTLTITKGARLYFKPGAYLFVKGSLLAEGDSSAADQILFRNQRLDPAYENQPGQWGGIIFLEGSKANLLRYCNIRNAEVGVRLGTPDDDAEPDVVLENCRLENHLQAGILCYTADLRAVNTLVANCVGPAVANLAGGNYEYIHCTFANYFRGQRTLPAALFSDSLQLADGSSILEDLNLHMQNTIIWGNLSSGEELGVLLSGSTSGAQLLEYNLLRSSDSRYAGQGNILSTDINFVRFQDVSTYNFRPDSLSPALNAAKPLGIEVDLSGLPRDERPDIGALEYRAD
ncbi:MAG: right-handed parallel beta-helix repeat-containing protein [Bacteroidetes bacterium]|nr:right-handed parallel beta-helix repeat-containing protein [Bacteroidota bacterium]